MAPRAPKRAAKRRGVDPQGGGASDRDLALQRIFATVDAIPKGSVATYGQVAEEAGLPRRARLVGHSLANLPKGSELPWHRVVNAAGRISARGGDGGSERTQARRLAREGVPLSESGRIDLKQYRWRP